MFLVILCFFHIKIRHYSSLIYINLMYLAVSFVHDLLVVILNNFAGKTYIFSSFYAT